MHHQKSLFARALVVGAFVAIKLVEAHGFQVAQESSFLCVDDFQRPDSAYHGDGWESLNPGYWRIEDQALRRRLNNVGMQARATGYPFHWETMSRRPIQVDYDPSLPFGMLWRRDWKLETVTSGLVF